MVDYEVIRQAFADILPADGNEVLRRPHLSGWHINVRYQDWIIKVANSLEGSEPVYREGMMCQRLQGKLSVNTPQPVGLFQQESPPYAGFGYKKLEGEDLAVSIMKKAVRPKMITQLTGLWHELQQLGRDNEIRPHLIDYAPVVDDLVDHLPVGQMRKSIMSANEVDMVITFAEWCRQLDKAVLPQTFLHGDFWSGNILANRDHQLVGLLDFSRCWYGDPIVDLAKLGYSDSSLINDILIYYNNHYNNIDIDKCILFALLHRGLFILLQLIRTGDVMEYYQKVVWMIIKSYEMVDNLVDQVGECNE